MEVRNISENKKKRKLLSTLTNLACRSNDLLYCPDLQFLFNFFTHKVESKNFCPFGVINNSIYRLPYASYLLSIIISAIILIGVFSTNHTFPFFIFCRIIRLPKNNKR